MATPTKPSKPANKPGWQTSEFGVTMTTVLGSLGMAAAQLAEPMAAQGHEQTSMWLTIGGMVAAAVASGAYSHGRSKVKSASKE